VYGGNGAKGLFWVRLERLVAEVGDLLGGGAAVLLDDPDPLDALWGEYLEGVGCCTTVQTSTDVPDVVMEGAGSWVVEVFIHAGHVYCFRSM
jgi:hypothetical protein